MMDPLHRRGILILVITALLWSSGGILIKGLPLSPLTIAGLRSAIAALTMIIWLRRPHPTWSPAQWGAIISYALTVSLFVVATKLTTAANAIFLQYSAPIWIALLSWLVTRERLKRIDVIVVAVVIVGMSIFFFERVDAGHMLGNIIGLCSGIAFGGVVLFLRAQRGKSAAESVLFGNVLTALICLPFFESFAVTPSVVSGLLALGILQLGVSYLLFAWAMKHVSAIEAILITTLEPVLNPVWVVLFYGERPSEFALIGGFIVVAGIVARSFAYARIQPVAHRGHDK